jgi:hypothetical protein
MSKNNKNKKSNSSNYLVFGRRQKVVLKLAVKERKNDNGWTRGDYFGQENGRIMTKEWISGWHARRGMTKTNLLNDKNNNN